MSLDVNARRILRAPSHMRCIVSLTLMARYICAVLAGVLSSIMGHT